MSELTAAISKSHDTAVGPDDIHYQMLKHLPAAALNTLLHIVNDIWSSGNFPSGWRISTVIPVLKPGKDTDPCNYHHIALTSCICKIVERMINDRLVWSLEKNKLLSSVRCGFRKRRSTTDHLVHLETFVRKANEPLYICIERNFPCHTVWNSQLPLKILPTVQCLLANLNLSSTINLTSSRRYKWNQVEIWIWNRDQGVLTQEYKMRS